MPLPSAPTIDALTTDNRLPTLAGTYDSANTTTFAVEVAGTTYTLGTDLQITHAGDAWSLAIDRPLPLGTLTVTATATNGSGDISAEVDIVLTAQQNEWRGDADATPPKITITITQAVAHGNYAVQITQTIYHYQAQIGDTVSGIASGLAADLARNQNWTVTTNGGKITITGKEDGVPIPGPIRSYPLAGSYVERVRAGQLPIPQQIQLTLPTTTTGGTWPLSLTVDGVLAGTAAAIGAAASAASVKAAVDALYAGADVTVELLGTAPRSYLLTLGGTLAGKNCAVASSGDDLTGNATVTIKTIQTAGANGPAVWMIAITGEGELVATVNGTSTVTSATNIMQESWWNARLSQHVTHWRSSDVVMPGTGERMYLACFALASQDTIAVAPNYSASVPANHASAEHLQQYQGATANEFQFVHPGVGARTYTFDGETTGSISSNGSLQTALAALSNVGSGNVTVHLHPGWYGIPSDIACVVEFEGDLGGLDQPLLTVSTGTAPELVADGASLLFDEIQQIIIAAAGGTIPFTFDGQTTDPLAYPFTAADLETALEALSTGGAGNLTCSGTNPWLVEGTGDFAQQDIPIITADVSSLTGGKPVIVTNISNAVSGVSEIQRIVVDPFAYAGSLLAGFEGRLTYPPLDWDADAADWQTGLQALSTIGAGNATVAGTATNLLVTFAGDLADQPLSLIYLDQSDLLVENHIITVELDQATGPNWFNVKENWSLGMVPNSLQDMLLSGGKTDILFGLTQWAAISLDDQYITLIGGGDLVDGQWVRFKTTGTLPAATVDGDPVTLSTGEDYYVSAKELVDGEDVVVLSLTKSGSPIVFTDAGNGTHYLGLALHSVQAMSRFSGAVGASQRDTSGNWYNFPRFLKVFLADPDGTNPNMDVGIGDGQGSARLNFDFGPSYLDGRVLATGSGATDPALCILNDNLAQSRLLNITGEIGLGIDAGQLVRLAKLQSFGGRVTAARFKAKRVEDYVRSVNWIVGQASADVVELGSR